MNRVLAASKIIKISLLAMLCFGVSQVVNGQEAPPFESPKTPVNCEMALSYVNDALVRYSSKTSNTDSFLIVIFRLGDGENFPNLNLKRMETLKSYIQSVDKKQNIKAVFAQGERVKGLGTIEIYMDGKLLYSLPIEKRRNLDITSCFAA